MALGRKVDATKLAEIRSKSRNRGVYGQTLKSFLESGDEAWEFSLAEDGDFPGKKNVSVVTGFRNAIKHKEAPAGADEVQVVADGESVYLVNGAAA